jgi:predicted DNA-binding protein (UPF0251 family)
MEKLKVDRTKLITQSAYAKKMAISKQLVSYQIKQGKLKTIVIDGATLILMD